jgi:hypothetical protein
LIFGSSLTFVSDFSLIGCTNITTITINKSPNTLAYAPWGAVNATIIWTEP